MENPHIKDNNTHPGYLMARNKSEDTTSQCQADPNSEREQVQMNVGKRYLSLTSPL